MAKKILAAYGDSLTEGWGLPKGTAFPHILGTMLAQKGVDADILNFGRSGDTATDALDRLSAVVDSKPDVSIVEFGANELFYNQSIQEMTISMDRILSALAKAGSKILVTGLKPVPGTPESKAKIFTAVYTGLSQKYQTAYYPDILEGLWGDTDLLQPDGIHPSEQGMKEIARRLFEPVLNLLR